MRVRTWGRLVAGLVAVGLLTAACGGSNSGSSSGGSGGGGDGRPVTGLRVLVPNSPGSGYDTTARAAVKAMQDAKLARNVEVSNVTGAAGTVGLQRVVNEKGKDDLIMQMGLGVVGAVYTAKSAATLADTTPLAKLIEEAEAIVVPANSPYQSISQLVSAWKADPGKLPVGGGSAPGGPDHLAPMLFAQAAGIAPTSVNYVSYDGGGELLAALLGAKVTFGATGVGEIKEQAKAGKLKVLAVTTATRVEGIDAPTLKEAGIDLQFSNWRGMVAPGGLTNDQKQTLVTLLTKMHDSTEWKATLKEKNWTDAFLAGTDFDTFLKNEDQRVAKILRDLGLAA
ncbi:MAG TPA: tripartite tricarboxylate transporter substrate binding protein [Pseudonocardiaceae bacterium]|jgi:putative tricarboxylic transport membrane protein